MTWFVGVEDDESGRKWSIDIKPSLMDDDDDDVSIKYWYLFPISKCLSFDSYDYSIPSN